MAPEIEEVDDYNDNPHNENTKKNDNYNNNNDSTDHSDGDINGNSDGDRGEDKKEDGRKGTSTRVSCCPLRLARSMITTRREKSNNCKKKDKKFDNKSDHMGNNSANPPEPQFCARFKNLKRQEQKCLSSFILFPENTVVKKRLLVYLWIGEGFLDDLMKKETTLEDSATAILNKFRDQSFILSVKKNCNKVDKSFKIPQDVHSQMISHSRSEGKVFQDDVYLLNNSGPLEPDNPENVKTLFNIGKGSLDDFKLETFTKMKNVKVLHLGRWQSSAGHHIEVKDSEFLKGLKNMEKLRFLSLQGISGIQELPRSISNLRDLRILDLRACYNLEKLPKDIASLKKLTHLDISECYLLDCMPKELLSLSELQVLKGFVITDTKNCTLADLAELKKLTKLSVNLNSENFSIENFSAVSKFKQLLKLKITWGGKFSKVNRNKKSQQEKGEAKSKATEDDNKRSLKRLESAVGEVILEKLELQCLPHKTLPKWVHPNKLRKLKKLYIRGGGLKTLGRIQEGDQEWEVGTLRLKYLNEFNMNWIELMALFPHLQYFEKFKCPKLTLCPCDCTGVWTTESPPQPQTTS